MVFSDEFWRSRKKNWIHQNYLVALRINLPNLCPNMNHFDAVEFSECHSEEVISFFWRSVYECKCSEHYGNGALNAYCMYDCCMYVPVSVISRFDWKCHEAGWLTINASALEVLGGGQVIEVGVIEQGFGRDAAHVQTRPSKCVILLHACRLSWDARGRKRWLYQLFYIHNRLWQLSNQHDNDN